MLEYGAYSCVARIRTDSKRVIPRSQLQARGGGGGGLQILKCLPGHRGHLDLLATGLSSLEQVSQGCGELGKLMKVGLVCLA